MQFKVIKDFLQPEIFNRVIYYADEIWHSPHNNFKTNRQWEETIIKDSNTILVHDIVNQQIQEDLRNELKKAYDYNINELMLYFYSPGCHIPWHNDSHCLGAVTIYLNDNWNRDHGGLYLYDSVDGIRGVVPEKNMLVFQPGGIRHSVSVLSPAAPFRVTIQAFMYKK
jgi:Rps23 Pro-64 3,4-dihydroxylase Tpa1-like proline 4-hydroxylase